MRGERRMGAETMTTTATPTTTSMTTTRMSPPPPPPVTTVRQTERMQRRAASGAPALMPARYACAQASGMAEEVEGHKTGSQAASGPGSNSWPLGCHEVSHSKTRRRSNDPSSRRVGKSGSRPGDRARNQSGRQESRQRGGKAAGRAGSQAGGQVRQEADGSASLNIILSRTSNSSSSNNHLHSEDTANIVN